MYRTWTKILCENWCYSYQLFGPGKEKLIRPAKFIRMPMHLFLPWSAENEFVYGKVYKYMSVLYH